MNKSVIKLSKSNNQLDVADGKHSFNLLTRSNITINNVFIVFSVSNLIGPYGYVVCIFVVDCNGTFETVKL